LMSVLLCTIGFSGQINILHANFFNVYRKQRVYFILAGTSLIGAGLLNMLAISLFGTLKAVASTAVVSFSIWYLLNEVALRQFVGGSIREIVKWMLVIGAYIGAFLGTYAVAETWIIGFGVYSVLFAWITSTCLHKETERLWGIILELYNIRKINYIG
jgi:O-antigen/teichoic acid export membrane protein